MLGVGRIRAVETEREGLPGGGAGGDSYPPRKAVKPCRKHSGLHSGTDEHGPLYLVEWQRGDVL